MAKARTWNELVRKAVLADERSLYRLGKDSGLRIAPLQRFAAAEHGLSLKSAEKLCAVLGWELRPITKKRKGR
jgi:hypothetical protein